MIIDQAAQHLAAAPGVDQRPLLAMRGLRIEARSGEDWQVIVHDLDLTLQRGEVLGLIGESGAGKSTIGLAAMAHVRQGCRFAGGSVLFDGRDLLNEPEAARRALRGVRIAYVAQSAAAAFNPGHRLIDQVIETAIERGGRSRAEATADALELFRRLSLPEPETIGLRYPHEVSGGQLQRVMTAMAMICRPDLIVFDEPTTALDVTTQVEVLAAIRGVVEDFHTAALYITHDLAVVAQLAHRVMVLRHGRLVEEAPTRTMLAAPREDYTRSLWAVRMLDKPAGPQASCLLRMKWISAAYGDHKVLDDISIDVERGRTVAVVGESGSGKSTLARVITGLLPPVGGTIEFADEPLPPQTKARSKAQLRRIQMIYQSPDSALNPRQTVRQVIGRPLEFYGGLRGRDREVRTLALLDMIEMGASHLDRLPGELSGGQKQRICIARALAAEPELVICDEVTSALDQIVQVGILKLLMQIQKELQLSYLFITHDIATVKAIADRIVVMHRGRIVEQGNKHDILSPPHPAYTELLLSSVPDMDPDWLNRLLAASRRGGAGRAASGPAVPLGGPHA